MAHAGTPSNLTHQQTPTIHGFWRAFIAAILVLAVAAGIVAVSSNLTSNAQVVPAAVKAHQIQAQPGLDIHKVVGHKGAMIYQ
jgi:anti-sigma-K factor RskA